MHLTNPAKKYFDVLNRLLSEYFAITTVRRLLPHIQDGDRVLDIGSGYGKQAELIQARKKCQVYGIDVVPYNKAKIPFKTFDGVHIPYEDNAFDVSYLAFVLHHAKEPIPLLQEALRVTRRALVIFEDTPRNFTDKLLDAFHGWSFNKYYKLAHKASFLTVPEWEKIFTQLSVKKVETNVFHRFIREPYFPVTRTKFVLHTTSGA